MRLDLKPFCYKRGDRPHLQRPFSFGRHTFATNGHILIRVERRASEKGTVSRDMIEAVQKLIAPAEARPLRKIKIPLRLISSAAVIIGDVQFAPKYVLMLLALPDIQVAAKVIERERMYFTFKGGVGALMPLNYVLGETIIHEPSP